MPDMMKLLDELEKNMPALRKAVEKGYSEEDVAEMDEEYPELDAGMEEEAPEDEELDMFMMEEDEEMDMPRKRKPSRSEDY